MLDDDGRLRVGSDGDDDVTVGHLVALTVGVDDRGPIELRVSRHRVVRDDGCAVGCDDGGAVLGFEDAELLGGFERDLLDRQAGRQICVDAQTSVSGLIGEEVAELADRREAPFLFAAVRDREVRGGEAAGAIVALRGGDVDVAAVRVLRDSEWVGGICHKNSLTGRSVVEAEDQPTAPSICSSMRRLSSSAYSIGSSRAIGSTKPRTIIAIASVSSMPRDMR